VILELPPRVAFGMFLRLCESNRVLPTLVERVAVETVAHLKGSKLQRAASVALQRLEQRWYQSLATGAPDYGVYGEDAYVGELWACWAVYSRGYLRALLDVSGMAEGSVVRDLGDVNAVVDLGCGFGWTTWALKELFPKAKVYGTNLEGTRQAKIAKVVGGQVGVEIVADVAEVGPVDLVFASEYFEHFPAPLDHLEYVLGQVSPRALLVANSFTARSIGHFEWYMVNGSEVTGAGASKLFNARLKAGGYSKVKTRMWNNRPAYWKLREG
jgi:SAM-dependent methyltransferase